MKRASRHLRVGLVAILGTLIVAFPVYAAASTTPVMAMATEPDIFITEFQTNGGSASQEFIELYNATDHDIDFGNGMPADSTWRIEFFSSTTPGASNSIVLKGVISSHDYFLVASTNYTPDGITADMNYDATSSHLMTDTGGGLQLMSAMTNNSSTWTVYDRVMWLDGSANPVLPGGVVVRPDSGKSQQRLPNDDAEYDDGTGGLTYFEQKDDISPSAAWTAPTLPVPTPQPTTTDTTSTSNDPGTSTDPAPSTNDQLPSTTTSDAPDEQSPPDGVSDTTSQPMITELLPNPASPQTDAADEFIELYNPNQTEIDLKGYTLEVGISTLHKFTFSDATPMPALGYRAFYSAATKLSLSNGGGQARLRDKTDAVVSETAIYGTAVDGTSWTLASGLWQWSTTPTPNALNILTTSPTKSDASTQKSAAASTASTSKKLSAAKTTKTSAKTTAKPTTVKGKTTTKKAKAATTKKNTKTTKVKTASTAAVTKPKPPIHTGVLVAVGSLAVLYGLYEYRHDITNALARLRGHRKTGRNDRQQIAWQ